MNNKKPDKKEIENKLNLVIDKLMNLGRPDNDEELEKGGESIGFFKRDFGIKEWDWPQGVGLYGLLKIMQINGNDEYREFLYKWFKENIAKGQGNHHQHQQQEVTLFPQSLWIPRGKPMEYRTPDFPVENSLHFSPPGCGERIR